ncbi:MAG: CARDB domain-containing protein [Dehalococcoidia bacterium]
MTSRVGSLLVASFLAALAVVAVVVIVILVDDGAGDDSAVIVPSLREDDLVLLGEPIEIQVIVRDTEPVTRVELAVDGDPTAAVTPVEDPVQGDFSATLSWIPQRLGFAQLTITATSLSGRQSDLQFRVEVTDDPARIASTFQLTILAPLPRQLVVIDTPLIVRARAQAGASIAVFVLEANGVRVGEVNAQPQGAAATGALPWRPTTLGPAVLRVIARTVNGDEQAADVTVEVVTEVAGILEQESEEADSEALGRGNIAIQHPLQEAEFLFAEDLIIDVDIAVSETGPLRSLELYVNNTLLLGVERERLLSGDFGTTIRFEPPQPGEYTLEVVAISESGERYDDEVTIQVVDPDAEEEEALDALPDLIPLAVRAGADNAIVVTLANQGGAAFSSTIILVSVIRSADGTVLDEATVNLALSIGGEREITLPIFLTEALAITVVLDSGGALAESNEANNEIAVIFQPVARPDLLAQGLELSLDRLVIVRISNVGTVTVSGEIVVLLLFNGEVVEQIAFTGVLDPQGLLQLSGSVPIVGGGELSAIVDPNNTIVEANEGNNTITIVVAP